MVSLDAHAGGGTSCAPRPYMVPPNGRTKRTCEPISPSCALSNILCTSKIRVSEGNSCADPDGMCGSGGHGGDFSEYFFFIPNPLHWNSVHVPLGSPHRRTSCLPKGTSAHDFSLVHKVFESARGGEMGAHQGARGAHDVYPSQLCVQKYRGRTRPRAPPQAETQHDNLVGRGHSG
jgi:hypothetical protein